MGGAEPVRCVVCILRYKTPVGITVACTYVKTLAVGTL